MYISFILSHSCTSVAFLCAYVLLVRARDVAVPQSVSITVFHRAQNKGDVSAFENVLVKCKGGTIVVVDMVHEDSISPASRAWCLYGRFGWVRITCLSGLSGSSMVGVDGCGSPAYRA